MKRLLAMVLASFLASAAHASPTNKPITIVVPYPAGGPTDKLAHDLTEALRKQLKDDTLAIEHTPGAGGTTGALRVARAPADGHTLLLTNISMATVSSLYKNPKYNPLEDFEFLGLVNEVPMTLIGRPGLQSSNWTELTKWIQANKDKVNLAHAGLGSASHLCSLMLQHALKVDLNTIVFSGTGPAMAAMLGDQVDLMCDQTNNTASQIESGAVKAYAVTSDKRLSGAALSKLPTFDESGLKGFKVTIWHGLYAPKGTPKAIVDKLNDALKVALTDAAFLKNQDAISATVVRDSRQGSAEHRKFVEAEISRWARIIKASRHEYMD